MRLTLSATTAGLLHGNMGRQGFLLSLSALVCVLPIDAMAVRQSTSYKLYDDAVVHAGGVLSGSGKTLFGVVETPAGVTTGSGKRIESGVFRLINGADKDGDLLPDYYEAGAGLNLSDPADGNTDTDGDGLTRGQEFQVDTDPDDKDTDDDGVEGGVEVASNIDPTDPDSDSDGIGDARDLLPSMASNECGDDPMTLMTLNVPGGQTLQCGAETSIAVENGVTIQSGWRLELISPVVKLENNLSIPANAELSIDSSDPTPP